MAYVQDPKQEPLPGSHWVRYTPDKASKIAGHPNWYPVHVTAVNDDGTLNILVIMPEGEQVPKKNVPSAADNSTYAPGCWTYRRYGA